MFKNARNLVSSVSGKLLQKAPLMLRGQRGRCRNIKGEQQIFGSLKMQEIWSVQFQVNYYKKLR